MTLITMYFAPALTHNRIGLDVCANLGHIHVIFPYSERLSHMTTVSTNFSLAHVRVLRVDRQIDQLSIKGQVPTECLKPQLTSCKDIYGNIASAIERMFLWADITIEKYG